MATAAEKGAIRFASLTATLTAAALIAQQIGSKATRDALFLADHASKDLPKIMVASAIVSLVAVLAMSRLLARLGPARAAPIAFFVSAMLYVLDWWLVRSQRSFGAIAVYLHVATFGSIVISGFWSVMSERFDPSTAKKAISRAAAGATFGGVIGGVVASRVADMVGAPPMLLVLAVMNVACGIGVLVVGRGHKSFEEKPGDEPSAWNVMKASSYLRSVAVLVVLLAMGEALVDFLLKSGASEYVKATDGTRADHRATLMSFFAIFYTLTGLLTFAAQSLFGRSALRKLGLGGTLAILPISVFATGLLGIFVQRFWSLIIIRSVESIFANSLFRAGYEILYAPLQPSEKRPVKTLIDVALTRVGDIAGSAMVLGILFVVPSTPPVVFVVLTLVVSVAMLWTTRRVHVGYVGSLGSALRVGSVELDDANVVDSTTKRTLAESTATLDRHSVLREIEKRRGTGHIEVQAQPATIVRDIEALLSRDPTRALRVLDRENPDRHLVPFIIDCLRDDKLWRSAGRALARSIRSIAGELGDALCDEARDPHARRRIARLLSSSSDPRAVAALLRALADARFDIRYEAGRALAKISARDPSLAPTAEQIHTVVLAELGQQGDPELEEILDEDGVVPESGLDALLRDRHELRLRHAFTLLGISYDAELLALSLRALREGEDSLRGTAREYLDNVLPEQVREVVYRSIGTSEAHARENSGRSIRDLQRELAASFAEKPITELLTPKRTAS